MSNMLNDTIDSAKHLMDSANEGAGRAVGTAKHAMGSVKENAEHAAARAETTWLDAVKAITGVITMVRGFQAEDALGWVGLARRRSPLLSFGIFGAGLAVGAGVGVLFAPASGRETRRQIARRFGGLEEAAKNTLDKAEADVKAEAKAVEGKAEKLAGKVKGAAIDAEQQVIDGAFAAKDFVLGKVDTAAQAVSEAAKGKTDGHPNPSPRDAGNHRF